jgi:ArsR family transcriptional regulator
MKSLPVMQPLCCPPDADPLDSEVCARLAAQFKALADPTRVALVSRIARGGEVCVCDLVDGSGRSQPTISHHLGVLRNAGLVTSRRKGTWAYYQVAADAIGALATALAVPAG